MSCILLLFFYGQVVRYNNGLCYVLWWWERISGKNKRCGGDENFSRLKARGILF
jgi:hypothetical protein